MRDSQRVRERALQHLKAVIHELDALCQFKPPSAALQLQEGKDPLWIQKRIEQLREVARDLALGESYQSGEEWTGPTLPALCHESPWGGECHA